MTSRTQLVAKSGVAKQTTKTTTHNKAYYSPKWGSPQTAYQWVTTTWVDDPLYIKVKGTNVKVGF